MNSLKDLKSIRQRTSTVPKVTTPKAKVQKTAQLNGNMSQSTKKSISKRRLLPAHAGVPITEKMKESIRRGFAEMKPQTEVPITKPQTTAATAPKITTPKSKLPKTVVTGTLSQSSKKVISKRRPIPAHSGVPITEKMKELLKKDLVEKNPPVEVRTTRQRASLAPTRERTNTAPKDASNIKPKGSENVPPSAKKTWKVPAHYGVPITEKMKQSLRRVSCVYSWGYRASDQRRWAVLHPACGGRQQSPIAIAARQAIPISIPAMELIGYQNPLPGPLTITNNGHSVALTIPKYSSEEDKKGFRLPYIFGGPLDNEYEIEGLHFHWGDKNNRGSEHTLNDMRLPLEMHIIHRNKKYRSLAEALQHPDGLCVLAFFYQVVEFEAKLLTPIVKNLTAIENYNTSMQLPHTFSLSSILSGLDTERFYTYKGSLTTPPCAEAVTWVVFSDYLPISVFQMDNFRGLLSNLNLPLVDNFRQLQPLFGRRIFVRITSKNPKFKKTKLHYSKWDWVGHKKAENDVAEFDE